MEVCRLAVYDVNHGGMDVERRREAMLVAHQVSPVMWVFLLELSWHDEMNEWEAMFQSPDFGIVNRSPAEPVIRKKYYHRIVENSPMFNILKETCAMPINQTGHIGFVM